MKLFSEGKSTGWNHIYFKIEYETIRDGTKLGIRWKTTYDIDKYWYYGYTLNAQIWTEETNHGGIIKKNFPSRGSGVSYFPSDTDYLWFEKSYSSNEINNCRVIINTTNGGSASYDTGADRTLYTEVGYTYSTIENSIDFNVGNNIPIVINDITNLDYNYKLYLEIYNESDTWQQIKYLETTSKNFTLDLSSETNTIYNLLPNYSERKIKVKLETYIGTTLLGTNIKDGNLYIINSNPDMPNFAIFGTSGGTTLDDEITSIWAGFGPYGDKSDAYLAVEDSSLQSKNGAILKKLIIEWNGEIQEVDL